MDLELKDLDSFCGTQSYHSLKPLFKTVATDGVAYIMDNGYSWLVTDALAVIEADLNAEFLVIKLKLGDKAVMLITDGDNKILYKQEYEFTDVKKEVKLFVADGVIMLSGEY